MKLTRASCQRSAYGGCLVGGRPKVFALSAIVIREKVQLIRFVRASHSCPSFIWRRHACTYRPQAEASWPAGVTTQEEEEEEEEAGA